MIVQDQLLLLHHFLNEITHTETDEAMTQLFERYRERLGGCAEDDVIYQLLLDAQTLGKENLFLKSCGTDFSRNRRLAALSAEEKKEFAEVGIILDENRFSYHFQPIVNTVDGSIYSYEALMRPNSDMRLTPFHILKYAELTGRLSDVESATFVNVLNIIDRNKEKFKGRRVFINSMPKVQLNGSVSMHVGELLLKHSDIVVVEITEQAETDDEHYLNMGVKIAIDDYGTGYSNVQNLLKYMPDYVKIDHSLISGIQHNPKKRHFVREIIDFCHGNSIMALAEGVETWEELRAVILLGADLIQGFYTGKPNAEIVDSISYDIQQEIKLCQLERQDGKDQQVYSAEASERIQLEKLVKDDYKCILVEESDTEDSEIAIIGFPTLKTGIHIVVEKDYKGTIILENVYLSNMKNRPCIDLGENSDVTLVLRGENRLDKSGIRVPESAKLTLEGDGVLQIVLDAMEYFGIGNDISSGHGDLFFQHSGVIEIKASGRTGVCVGSGLGGNISIGGGRVALNVTGHSTVGIGAFSADSKLEINNCAVDTDITCMKGVAIGSMEGSADVHIGRSAAKLRMSGEEIAAIGTVGTGDTIVQVNNGVAVCDIIGSHCTGVGSLNGSTDFKAKNASFRAAAVGEQALPFGGLNGNTKVYFVIVDTDIKLDTGADIETYCAENSIRIIGGRTSFLNRGKTVILKGPSKSFRF